ncbi:hypothetical protein GS636_21490 [Ruegeria sp. HKCCD4884]|uniref:bifunctional DNA primase/polymerase n=1 Tax=Ruegeria sp. HKCCD4884 TaxID=2683022 RepID=UPI001490B07D|nr:bifunctional DNA primase/polymerase [Ruegeria sp. HKCCD4884]NOD95380.1 hypothetical protein [Ruegeria sp. HKCCD4884]
MTTPTYASAAPQLAMAGWDRLIPLKKNDKAPRYPGWEIANEGSIPSEKFDAWVKRGAYDGIGCASGGWALGVDLDHKQADHAAAVHAIADEYLGRTPLIRVGQAPKTLRIYRQNADDRIQTRTHRDIDVGLYGTTGQFVLYGMHPLTGAPYYYTEVEPLEISPDDVPLVTSGQIDAFISELQRLNPTETRHDFDDVSAGQFSLSADIGARVEDARFLDPDRDIADVVAQIMREASQRHPTMTAIVAYLSSAGWDEEEIINAIAEPYLDHFVGNPREVASRYQKLLKSIDGALAKGIATDLPLLVANTGFSKWGRGLL